MALIIGGCPRRQTNPRIVYVPSPPPETSSAEGPATATLVIEEPLPSPQPQQPAAQGAPASRPVRRRRHLPPPEPDDTVEPLPEPEEPPPSVEVPALEPRESRENESALRSQVLGLQNDVQRQVAERARATLTVADRKTLEDARTFLAQSRKALEEGDLQRSLNLARKASLLMTALSPEQ